MLDEAVSVVDIAQWINNINSVKLLHSLVDMGYLAEVFNGVADIHCKCMAKQAVYGEMGALFCKNRTFSRKSA